jgi:VWFA-related protein
MGKALLLGLVLAGISLPAQQPQPQYTLRANAELVLVNVTVRDRKGDFVRNLTQNDFSVLEDGKAQHIASFDVENTDAAPETGPQQTTLLGAPTGAGAAAAPASTAVYKDRRLVILFFDLTSMQPEEIERAVKAAENYVDTQMAPADLVAVASLGNSLKVDLDFTADRAALKKALAAYSVLGGQGYEAGSTGTTEGTPDTGQSFTPDETEYNIFNTDRRLEAIRSLSDAVARIDQKKSLIYFSSGMDRTGIENQSELRATTNAAVRANLAIYTMDLRGLEALVPGGEAQQASLRGTAAYSGRATMNQLNSNFSSQETLVTLAGDTGGRAFLDSNDFSRVFRQVQEDTGTYYVLGYRSSNPARDGRFRRITVRLNRQDVKLEFRRGYYAPSDFQHSSREDRERQLAEALASDLPVTDFPVYLATAYFRSGGGRFFVPVSLAVPGWEIPFTHGGDQDKATLDVMGVVQDETQRPVGQTRDTVKLNIAGTRQVQRKNVQYDTAFLLPSGKYHLKFVVRENQSGRMGSFETDLVIPDLDKAPLKLSAIVLASQMQAAGKGKNENPLVRDGNELIPNVTHLFSSGQHLYFYYEVYDPGREGKEGVHVLSNVAFFRGKVKAYETPLVEARQINLPDRHAISFQLDVPLSQLKAGFYVCQVNVVDDAAGRFQFPRLGLLIRP